MRLGEGPHEISQARFCRCYFPGLFSVRTRRRLTRSARRFRQEYWRRRRFLWTTRRRRRNCKTRFTRSFRNGGACRLWIRRRKRISCFAFPNGNAVKFVPGGENGSTAESKAGKNSFVGADDAVPPGSTRVSVIDPKTRRFGVVRHSKDEQSKGRDAHARWTARRVRTRKSKRSSRSSEIGEQISQRRE